LAGCAGRLLIAIAAQTTAAAALSYYLLERPAQRLRPRRK
jgi:peptidoglycan/LPS O-acetylase OafA/YrhL